MAQRSKRSQRRSEKARARLKAPGDVRPIEAAPAKFPRILLRWLASWPAIIGAGVALFGAYAGWRSLLPSIAVEIQPSAKSAEQFSPYFVVRNTGYIAATDVVFTCADVGYYDREPNALWPEDYKQTKPRYDGVEYEDIGTLNPGEQAVRRCKVRDAPPGFHRTEGSLLVPIINYRSTLYPWMTTQSYFFEVIEGGAGVEWQFRGNGLTDQQVAWLHDRGHPTMRLDPGSEGIAIEAPNSN